MHMMIFGVHEYEEQICLKWINLKNAKMILAKNFLTQ